MEDHTMNAAVKSYEQESKTIDGTKYTVTLFPAGPGFQLLFELKNVLGDSMGAVLGQEAESIITKIGGTLSKEEILNLVVRLLELTLVEGRVQPIDKAFFDSHFAGKYGHLMKVLSFVVEVNFSDFFDEIKNMLLNGVKRFNVFMGSMGATSSNTPSTSQKN
jgi:hypothetical protein